MDDNKPNSDENPLEELASQLSNSLDSKSIEVTDFSTEKVEGGQIQMDGSFARSIEGQAIYMEGSGAGLLKTQVAELNDSVVGILATKSATIEEANSLGLVAQNVQADSIFSFLFLARRVDGEVKAVFTPGSALALGAGLGLMLFIARRILIRLWPFRRRNANTKN